eukprot:8360898-Prorocentrum_lima.AAC.1
MRLCWVRVKQSSLLWRGPPRPETLNCVRLLSTLNMHSARRVCSPPLPLLGRPAAGPLPRAFAAGVVPGLGGQRCLIFSPGVVVV